MEPKVGQSDNERVSTHTKPLHRKESLKSPFFQPKLTVAPANDKYEQEADSVAEKVVNANDVKNVQTSISSADLQRKCSACDEDDRVHRKEKSDSDSEQDVSPLVSEAIGSVGSALDDGTRTFMEDRMGYDFGDVKIHTNTVAAKSADALNALAFTSGNDVVFNTGQYKPQSTEGMHLLAHELTHVIQQKGAGAKHVQRQTGPDPAKEFPKELAYITSLNSKKAIQGDRDGRLLAVSVVDYWKKGYPHFMLSTALKILIIQELMNTNGDLPDDYQKAILSLVQSMGKEELDILFATITSNELKGDVSESIFKEIEAHKKKGAKQTASTSAFSPEKIMALRDKFLANAQLSGTKKQVCIAILENQLAKTYKGDSGEQDVKDAITNSATDVSVSGVTLHAHSVDNLIHQLKGTSVEEDVFVTDYGRVKDDTGEKAKVPSKSMNKSAFSFIKKSVGSQVGWHVFIMSVKHGYHSVTLFVEKRANGDLFLYWADQNYTGHENYLKKDGGSMAGFKQYGESGFDDYVDFATREFWNDSYDATAARLLKKDPKISKNDIFAKADTKTTLTILKLKRASNNNPYK